MQQALAEKNNIKYLLGNKYSKNSPWFYIKQYGRCAFHYKYDWLSSFFGDEDNSQEGIGFKFKHTDYIELGTKLEINFPFNKGNKFFKADVVLVEENENGYEVGIWLNTPSNDDLQTLLSSCEYTSKK